MQQKTETRPPNSETVVAWGPLLLPGDLSNLMVPRDPLLCLRYKRKNITKRWLYTETWDDSPPWYTWAIHFLTISIAPWQHQSDRCRQGNSRTRVQEELMAKLDVSSRMRKKMGFSYPHFSSHHKTVAHEVPHVALPDRVLLRLTAACSNKLLLTHRCFSLNSFCEETHRPRALRGPWSAFLWLLSVTQDIMSSVSGL